MCSSFDCLVSICANFVAYFSFRAEGVKWTTDQCISIVIIIDLMFCTPSEITVARLCPGIEIVLAPPLPTSFVDPHATHFFSTSDVQWRSLHIFVPSVTKYNANICLSTGYLVLLPPVIFLSPAPCFHVNVHHYHPPIFPRM